MNLSHSPRLAGVAALALVAALGACAKKAPEPAPVVLSAGEQVCVDHTVAVTGLEPSTISIIPASATKTGETIYEVTAGDAGYNCAVGADMQVSSFTPRTQPLTDRTLTMPHEFACRVYYEDTDLAGIVYYANYLRFIERGRSEALSELGLDQRLLRDGTGMVFAVRRVEADYLAPAHLLDRLRVLTSVSRLGGASVDLDQQVWRGETCLFRARVVVVAIGADGRPLRLPPAARDALARIGGPAEE